MSKHASWLIICCTLFPWWLFLGGDLVNLGEQSISPWAPLGYDTLGRNYISLLSLATWTVTITGWIICGVFFSIGAACGCLLGIAPQSSRIITTLVETALSIPGILALFALGAWGLEVTNTAFFGFFALTAWGFGLSSTTRLTARDCSALYWAASRSQGAGPLDCTIRHGLKTTWRRPLVDRLFSLLHLYLFCEISISFTGFGIQPPAISFGSIQRDLFANSFQTPQQGYLLVATVLILSYGLRKAHRSLLLYADRKPQQYPSCNKKNPPNRSHNPKTTHIKNGYQI